MSYAGATNSEAKGQFLTLVQLTANENDLKIGAIVFVSKKGQYDISLTQDTGGFPITQHAGSPQLYANPLQVSIDGAVKSVNSVLPDIAGDVALTKSDFSDLNNVDNTSDVDKPVSTAQQTAINAKQDSLTAGANIDLTSNVASVKSVKTTATTGQLPNNAVWLVDTSGTAYSRAAPTNPKDGETFSAKDTGNSAETNSATITVVGPTTIVEGFLDSNGQSKEWRYDSTGDVWDLVFSQAPASGGGAVLNRITNVRASVSNTATTTSFSAPVGTDWSKTYVQHSRSFMDGFGVSSPSNQPQRTASVEVDPTANQVKIKTVATSSGAGNLGRGYMNLSFVEFDSGVACQHGKLLTNLTSYSSTSTRQNQTFDIPISTLSDPTRAFAMVNGMANSFGSNYGALALTVVSIESNKIVVRAHDYYTAAGTIEFSWSVVEYL